MLGPEGREVRRRRRYSAPVFTHISQRFLLNGSECLNSKQIEKRVITNCLEQGFSSNLKTVGGSLSPDRLSATPRVKTAPVADLVLPHLASLLDLPEGA